VVCSTVHTIFDHRLETICVELSVEKGLGSKRLVAKNAREALEEDIRLTLSDAV